MGTGAFFAPTALAFLVPPVAAFFVLTGGRCFFLVAALGFLAALRLPLEGLLVRFFEGFFGFLEVFLAAFFFFVAILICSLFVRSA